MTETLPAVPLRDVVMFPHMLIPFIVGRPQSIRALEDAFGRDHRVFVAAQHDASVDDPRPDHIYAMGCVANVFQSLKMPDGTIKVLAEGIDARRRSGGGKARASIKSWSKCCRRSAKRAPNAKQPCAVSFHYSSNTPSPRHVEPEVGLDPEIERQVLKPEVPWWNVRVV